MSYIVQKFALLMMAGLKCIIRDVLELRLSPEAWLDNDEEWKRYLKQLKAPHSLKKQLFVIKPGDKRRVI